MDEAPRRSQSSVPGTGAAAAREPPDAEGPLESIQN